MDTRAFETDALLGCEQLSAKIIVGSGAVICWLAHNGPVRCAPFWRRIEDVHTLKRYRLLRRFFCRQLYRLWRCNGDNRVRKLAHA